MSTTSTTSQRSSSASNSFSRALESRPPIWLSGPLRASLQKGRGGQGGGKGRECTAKGLAGEDGVQGCSAWWERAWEAWAEAETVSAGKNDKLPLSSCGFARFFAPDAGQESIAPPSPGLEQAKQGDQVARTLEEMTKGGAAPCHSVSPIRRVGEIQNGRSCHMREKRPRYPCHEAFSQGDNTSQKWGFEGIALKQVIPDTGAQPT
ncbi:hypothetical protein I7I51_06878 [Histoplasma capsulatum]|uniref:Uncharacterized protein n=1 Tax=Ajellomyces capsulatus TaxID=5037 RepID=A0A8A1MPM7_AJECA|nr:hypothetical protein I7I51_06878 [Histoplasma capsulatum]